MGGGERERERTNEGTPASQLRGSYIVVTGDAQVQVAYNSRVTSASSSCIPWLAAALPHVTYPGQEVQEQPFSASCGSHGWGASRMAEPHHGC